MNVWVVESEEFVGYGFHGCAGIWWQRGGGLGEVVEGDGRGDGGDAADVGAGGAGVEIRCSGDENYDSGEGIWMVSEYELR